MPVDIRQFKILLSAPNNTKHECEIAEEELESINREFSEMAKVRLQPVDWNHDSWADSGDEAQGILNREIVEDSDIVLAIFRDRFGTETKHFGSGTEEEVDLIQKKGGHVLLFFWQPPADFSPDDPEQYERVIAYKNGIDNALYKTFTDEDDFRKQIRFNLRRVLFALSEQIRSTKPLLTLSSISATNELLENKVVTLSRITARRIEVKKYEQKITRVYEQIASIKIKKIEVPAQSVPIDNKVVTIQPSVAVPDSLSKSMQAISESYSKIAFKMPPDFMKVASYYKSSKVEIPEYMQEAITVVLSHLGIEISKDFFYLGKLEEHENPVAYRAFGDTTTQEGTEDEKKKYRLLEELFDLCMTEVDFREFLNRSSEIGGVGFVITNNGGRPANNVQVRITLPANCFLMPNDIPVPNDDFIECGLQNGSKNYEFASQLYGIEETSRYLPYKESETATRGKRYSLGHLPSSALDPYGKKNDRKKEYLEDLNALFSDYSIIEDKSNGKTTIRINFDRVQQNMSYAFPTYLLKKAGSEGCITYQIVADEIEKPLEGELSFGTIEEHSQAHPHLPPSSSEQ